MDDELIIELLFSREEKAIDEVSCKYRNTLYSIAFNILKNKEDAEECLNDTYLAVWNKIPPERPQYLSSFLCRITRNISIARYRYKKAQKRDNGGDISFEEAFDYISDDEFSEQNFEENTLTQIIENWLYSQNEQNRYIFIRRYWFADGVDLIAKNLKISPSAVYLRIDRMKKSLKKQLKQNGVIV